MEVVLIVIVMFCVFGGVTGAIASSMGHGFWPFFFIGALISPLLGIILCFVIKPQRSSRSTSRYGKRRGTGRGGTRSVARGNRVDASNPYSPPRRTYR